MLSPWSPSRSASTRWRPDPGGAFRLASSPTSPGATRRPRPRSLPAAKGCALREAADLVLREPRFGHNSFKSDLARRAISPRSPMLRRHARVPVQPEDRVMNSHGTLSRPATSRVAGSRKSTGAPICAEFNPRPAPGSMVAAKAPRCFITRIDAAASLQVEGVIAVLTPENRPAPLPT